MLHISQQSSPMLTFHRFNLYHLSMTINDSGDFFKARERALERCVHGGVGLRIDGRAFHTLTRRFKRPYDHVFGVAMDAAAITVVTALHNVVFAYVQSDEISVILAPTEKGLLPFAGKVEKLASASASAATIGFATAAGTSGLPMFDSRAFSLRSLDEVRDYVEWRRGDARKNAVGSAVRALYSTKELEGVSLRKRYDLLEGTEFEKLPDGFFHGRFIITDDVADRLGVLDSASYEAASSSHVSVPAVRALARNLIDDVRDEGAFLFE